MEHIVLSKAEVRAFSEAEVRERAIRRIQAATIELCRAFILCPWYEGEAAYCDEADVLAEAMVRYVSRLCGLTESDFGNLGGQENGTEENQTEENSRGGFSEDGTITVSEYLRRHPAD